MVPLNDLINKWSSKNASFNMGAKDEEIHLFQKNNNVVIPNDLIQYFKLLNGTGDNLGDDFFEFYSIKRIKPVIEEFIDWEGIPDYKSLISSFPNRDNVYVFANYYFNLFAYGIRLYSKVEAKNEVYVFCGDEYKKIANSFTEFIELYLSDSVELQFNT